MPDELVSENSNRFGEPVPALVILFSDALLVIVFMTVATEALGFDSNTNAATPVTCGAAIDVPEIVFVAVSLVDHAEVIDEPGAKTSTHAPKFEKVERASLLVVEPTVSAVATLAGEKPHAS